MTARVHNAVHGRSVVLVDAVVGNAVVTASSTAVGSDARFAASGFTYDYWTAAATGTHDLTFSAATAITVDALGITEHNFNGGSLRLQGSNDGTTYVDLLPGASKLVDTDAPLLLRLPKPVAYTFYRLRVTHATSAPSVAVVGLGQLLRLQRGAHQGHAPPVLNPVIEYSTPETDGGAFAGRSIVRRFAQLSISLDNVTETWLREHWQPFVKASRLQGFWFSADVVNRPADVFFGYTTQEPGATHNTGRYMTTELQARGVA